jgi:predicted metal-dependent peptidase
LSLKKFKLRKLTPMEKLMKARVILLKERPFFGTLVLHLRFIEADTKFLEELIPTMGIDKWGRLFFAPSFVDTLNLEELLSVMCHEVHHAVLLHLDRKMSRDEDRWNIAADLVINEILVQNKFTLGDGWLHESEYRDWYVEEIYEDLGQKGQGAIDKMSEGQIDVHVYFDVDNKDDERNDTTCDNCKGSGKDPKTQQECPECEGTGKGKPEEGDGKGKPKNHGFGESEGETKDQPHWDKILKEAYSYSKQQGKAPLGMDRIIDGLTESQVPWQSVIKTFVQATLPKDYTYYRPHKRAQLAGFYIPSLKKEEIEIFVGIDTSGSISDTEYKEFISEIVGLDNQYKGRIKFTIITCDAEVQTVDNFDTGFDPRKLRARGYGGTRFMPVFEHVREHFKKCKLLIYMTDLYGDEDSLEASRYNFHTLWILTQDANSKDPPFGTWVRLEKPSNERGVFGRPY